MRELCGDAGDPWLTFSYRIHVFQKFENSPPVLEIGVLHALLPFGQEVALDVERETYLRCAETLQPDGSEGRRPVDRRIAVEDQAAVKHQSATKTQPA